VWDDDDIARAHAVYAAADRQGRRYAVTWPLPEMTASLRTPSSTYDERLYVAEGGGEVLGTARLSLPLTDNLHLAEMAVHVRPDRRRRGVGTRLAAHLRAQAEQADRRLAGAWVAGRQLRPDGSELDGSELDGSELDGSELDGPELSGDAFARACGLTLRNTDLHRVLSLPVDDELLDALAAEITPHHADYRLVSFTGPCPDEYVAAYCRLKAAMLTEAPMGDVEMDPEIWDERRLREEEDELAAMRRLRSTVLALDPDGEVAGFNELLYSEHDPGRIWNWDTLVVRAHRGHRLGMAVKIANLRAVPPAHPEAFEVHTHNAAQNGPMVAVNDRLGFVPVERMGEWQGPVAGLPAGP